VSKTSASSEQFHDWTFYINDNSGGEERLSFRLTTVNGFGTTEALEGYNMLQHVGQWVHVAVTYNESSGQIVYFVNGAQVGTDAHNTGGAVITGTGETVSIGNAPQGQGDRYFDGIIDEVRVYERGLSTTEMADMYTDLSDEGNDTLNGDTGDDFLYGGTGNNSLSGGDGNDTIYSVSLTDSASAFAADGVLTRNIHSFNTNNEGFIFFDDGLGNGTGAYADGFWTGATGNNAAGSLYMVAGGVNNTTQTNMVPLHFTNFTKTSGTSHVTLKFSYRQVLSAETDAGDNSNFLVQLTGLGTVNINTLNGAAGSITQDTGWVDVYMDLGVIAAQNWQTIFAGQLTRKNATNETSQWWIDDIEWIEQEVGVTQGFTNTLYGNDGLDILYGGSQTDIFVMEAASAYNQTDQIVNFNVLQNDQIDISDLLTGFTAGSDEIADFARFVNSGGNSLLQVDADGTANGTNYQTVAQVNGMNDLDAFTLYAAGNLVA
jgi:hypothetical protein